MNVMINTELTSTIASDRRRAMYAEAQRGRLRHQIGAARRLARGILATANRAG